MLDGTLSKIVLKGNNLLSTDQVDILQSSSDEQIVLTKEAVHFILNFFWVVGLANNNLILTDGHTLHGLIVQDSNVKIEDFASTGRWTLGTKPVNELYA